MASAAKSSESNPRGWSFGGEGRGENIIAWLRERPLVGVAAVGVLGAALGGLVFSKLGRLAFAAAAGYAANELWHREGRLDIDDVLERLLR